MNDAKMREAETACKLAAVRHRLELREAQTDLADVLVGGGGHRTLPAWDTDPLMAMPKRRRKAREAPGRAP